MCSTAGFSFLCPVLQLSLNVLVLHILNLLPSDCCGLLSSTHNGTPASTNTCSRRFCTFLYRLPLRVAGKAQAAASNAEGHIGKQSAIAKSVGDVSEVASSGGAHSAASSDNQQVLWLVLQESRYDAIASGRLRWEARPRDGTVREINNHLRDPYFDWTLAQRGRSVVLQRGMGTGTYRKHAATLAMSIAQVRIFSSAYEMVKFLAADLVPNCTDPIKFYKDLYGGEACAHAFVTMRLELPKEAPAASQERSVGSNSAGTM